MEGGIKYSNLRDIICEQPLKHIWKSGYTPGSDFPGLLLIFKGTSKFSKAVVLSIMILYNFSQMLFFDVTHFQVSLSVHFFPQKIEN